MPTKREWRCVFAGWGAGAAVGVLFWGQPYGGAAVGIAVFIVTYTLLLATHD